METVMRLTLLGIIAIIIQGCSSQEANRERKDLSILEAGTHRDRVLSELGQPVVSEKDDNGNKIDFFKFHQGNHVAVKAGKAVGYSILSYGTGGGAEFIIKPLERSFGGTEIQLRVGYTSDDLVDDIVVLKDDRWIPIQGLKEESLD